MTGIIQAVQLNVDAYEIIGLSIVNLWRRLIFLCLVKPLWLRRGICRYAVFNGKKLLPKLPVEIYQPGSRSRMSSCPPAFVRLSPPPFAPAPGF